MFFTFSLKTYSQEKLTYEKVNEKTYEYYLNKNWKELISFGNKALKQNIDFYYLRYRLGIAYYETEKFISAIPEFLKAFEVNPADNDLNEYLYYSYLLSGNSEEAGFYFSKLSESRKNKIRPLNNTFVNDFIAESGTGINNDLDKNETADIDGQDNIYGEQILNDNYFYFRTGLKQIPFQSVSIKYNYSYLNLKKKKVIRFNDENHTDNYSQKQNQFYNGIDILLPDGLIISPAGQYINSKDKTIYAEFDSAMYVYDSLSMTYKPVKYFYNITERETNMDNFVLSLSISKTFSLFKAGLNGSFSYLNDFHQSQLGTSFTYYPLENVYLYSKSDFTLHRQKEVTNLIFSQTIGGRITDRLFMDLFFTYGRMNNFNEQNGAIVYNNPDVIKYKFGAELNYYFPFNLNAYIVYLNQSREKKYLSYFISGYSNSYPVYSPDSFIQNYNTNIFLAGLKLLF